MTCCCDLDPFTILEGGHDGCPNEGISICPNVIDIVSESFGAIIKDRDKTSLFAGWNMAEGLLYVKERINTACCVAENQDGPESVTQTC